MAKIQFRNDSAGTIYLDSFGHQQILVSEVIELFDQETKLKGDSQIVTLINAGDLVLIDDTDTDRTAAEALKILDGTVDLVKYGGTSYELLCTDPSGDITWSAGAVLIKEEGTLVNSVPFNTLNFAGSSITATDAGSGQVNITVVNPIFGSEFEEAESDGQSDTTSTSYVVKLTHTTPSLPSGSYRVGYSFEGAQSDDKKLSTFEVKIGTDVIANPTMEPAADLTSFIWSQFGGFVYRTLSGANTIIISFKSSSAIGTAKIRKARLEIWRVS